MLLLTCSWRSAAPSAFPRQAAAVSQLQAALAAAQAEADARAVAAEAEIANAKVSSCCCWSVHLHVMHSRVWRLCAGLRFASLPLGVLHLSPLTRSMLL